MFGVVWLTGVVIAASDRDKKMWRLLPEILRQSFSVVSAQELDPDAPPAKDTLVICGPQDAARIRPDHAVVVYKDADDAQVHLPPRCAAVAVVDSASSQLMERVSATGLPAITCGLSPRDTLTLPSYGVDSAVLGLQRSIVCFDGSVCEPQEIPLQKTGSADSFTLMAVSSVFLLTGNLDRLRLAGFWGGAEMKPEAPSIYQS